MNSVVTGYSFVCSASGLLWLDPDLKSAERERERQRQTETERQRETETETE